jgi:RNA polymerase sigma factor (sigma-70 family)
MNSIEDQRLIVKISQGDNKAFELLLGKYQNLIFGLSLKLVKDKAIAEDLTQETWMKIIKFAHQYSPIGSVKSWILQIHRNLVFDYFRDQKKWKDNADIDDIDIADDSENAFEIMDSQEKQATFQKIFYDLEERDKLVLTMVVVEELSYSEISKALSLTIASIKTIVFRAKNKLKEKLAESNGGL